MTWWHMANKDYAFVRERFEEQIPYIREAMPEFLDTSVDGGACYTASELSREIFEEFGIESQVVFVRGFIENEKAKELRESVGLSNPTLFREMCVALDGYVMGVGVGRDPNGKPNFHSVLWFPETDEILDLTINQMTRPKYGIIMPDYFYGDVDEYMELFSDGYDENLPHLFHAKDFNKVFCPLIDRERDRANRLKATVVKRMKGDA